MTDWLNTCGISVPPPRIKPQSTALRGGFLTPGFHFLSTSQRANNIPWTKNEPRGKPHMSVRGVSKCYTSVRGVSVTRSCLTLCDPMDCSPPGSSVRGILQARTLEWVAISFSTGSSQPRDRTPVSCTAGRFFTDRATREAPSGGSRSYKKPAIVYSSPSLILIP